MAKKKKKEEEPKYKFPSGNPIDYYTFDLENILGDLMSGFESFFRLLEGNEEDDSIMEVATVGKELIQNANEKMYRAIKLIEDNLGEITIDFASRQVGYARGDFLGLNFTPAAKKQEPQPASEEN